MIYLDINLDHLCTSDNHIGCIYPNVRIGMDCSDNVDVQKMRNFQKNLQRYIERGLNDCLILHAEDGCANGKESQLATRVEL